MYTDIISHYFYTLACVLYTRAHRRILIHNILYVGTYNVKLWRCDAAYESYSGLTANAYARTGDYAIIVTVDRAHASVAYVVPRNTPCVPRMCSARVVHGVHTAADENKTVRPAGLYGAVLADDNGRGQTDSDSWTPITSGLHGRITCTVCIVYHVHCVRTPRGLLIGIACAATLVSCGHWAPHSAARTITVKKRTT